MWSRHVKRGRATSSKIQKSSFTNFCSYSLVHMLHFIYLFVVTAPSSFIVWSSGERKRIFKRGIGESSNKYEFTLRDKLWRSVSFMTVAYATMRVYALIQIPDSHCFYLVLFYSSYIFISFVLLSVIRMGIEVPHIQLDSISSLDQLLWGLWHWEISIKKWINTRVWNFFPKLHSV